jgi:putative transposase
LKFVSWKDRKAIAKDLKAVYIANTEEQALTNLNVFHDIWGSKYPHIKQS